MNTRILGITTNLLLVGFVLNDIAFAKPQVYQWSTELCLARATYDDQKVSAHQLKATQELNQDRLISLYDDKSTQTQNDVEHVQKQKFLNQTSNFIAHPAVEVVRIRMIERDQFFYELDRVKRSAKQTQQFQILNDFKPAQTPACQNIAQWLQSPASAEKTKVATTILSDSCRDNANPDQCVARSLHRWTQSIGAMNAELLDYHWANCANHQQPDITEAEREASEKVFKQTVGKIRYYDCDEP